MKERVKIIFAFLAGALIFGGIGGVYAATSDLIAKQSTYKVTINGKERTLSNSPVTINGSAYLPVREVGNITGYDVGFQSGVISLTNDENNTSETPSTHNFEKLPITKTFDDYVVTVNSAKHEDTKIILDVTVRNNSDKTGSVNFSHNMLSFNYGVQDKKLGTTGTLSVNDFPSSIPANSEVNGLVEKNATGLKDIDVENAIFYVVVGNIKDKAIPFYIDMK